MAAPPSSSPTDVSVRGGDVSGGSAAVAGTLPPPSELPPLSAAVATADEAALEARGENIAIDTIATDADDAIVPIYGASPVVGVGAGAVTVEVK